MPARPARPLRGPGGGGRTMKSSAHVHRSFLRATLANLVVTVPLVLLLAGVVRAQPRPGKVAEMTGPFVHENLAVFLLHDKAASGDEDIVTLGEALATGDVVLEETGQVNQLVISNKGTKTVYLQAGDIVKGGRQD